MNDWRKILGGKGLLIALLTNKPWLIPFIYHIHSLQGVTLNELKELLGLKTSIIKRGLWWLLRNGIVEKSGEKYIIAKEYIKHVDELLLDTCTTQKEYVVRYGKTYFVAIVRRARITAYTVPEEIFKDFLNRKLENRSVKDIASETGYPERLVARVVKLYQILEICRRG